MTLITSAHNTRLKQLRRLHRRRERDRSQRFLAEGEDLIDAAQRAGRPLLEGYRVAGAGVAGADIAGADIAGAGVAGADIAGEGFVDVQPAALAQVSTLGSGTRAIGVYEQRFLDAPIGPLCVYLHGIGDPGNIGTILRAAEAFGVSCVALGPGCADPHSPKAVRASMGAIFSVSLARVAEVVELPGARVALVAHQGETLRKVALALAPPLTLLIGAEREGLPPELLEICEHTAHIPIRTESLNAAMAATVALYEMTGERGARLVGCASSPPSNRVLAQ